jgi:ABC-type transport system involved in multi-copper enzyme maturation permease subunit
MTYSSTTRPSGSPFRVLLAKELRSAVRFYPVILALVTLNLGIAVGAPIVGKGLATIVDVLTFMILMTTYTMMGFSVSSFAEDKQDGTLELLVTCPVSKLQVLLSKLSLGLVLAVPLAILPYGISAYFFMGVSAFAVAGLAIASIFASVTAASVALLMVVLIKRIEIGVYLGFMVAWITSFTPSYVLRLPVVRYLLPGYFVRDLFVSVGQKAVGAMGQDVLVLAALGAAYLLIAASIMEREDAVLTAA